MNAQVTDYQISLLHHTLGLSEHRRESYRNHFVAGDGHSDMRHLEALERVGLMERRRSPGFLADGDIVFAATDTGREAAIAALPAPKKRTKADDWYDRDGCESFGEFLCGSRLPEYESRQPWRHEGLKTGRGGYQWRMFRCRYHRIETEIAGEWCATKKDAKASYKAALKAHKAGAA